MGHLEQVWAGLVIPAETVFNEYIKHMRVEEEMFEKAKCQLEEVLSWPAADQRQMSELY